MATLRSTFSAANVTATSALNTVSGLATTASSATKLLTNFVDSAIDVQEATLLLNAAQRIAERTTELQLLCNDNPVFSEKFNEALTMLEAKRK